MKFLLLLIFLPSSLSASAQSNADPHASSGSGALSPRYDPAIQHVEPFRIFDTLSYVGVEWVSAYVLETSEGLIILDSLYGQFVDHLFDGVHKLGLDPANIKYVLCTHGHWDHVAGAH